ncbi:hypothetical protein V5O48_016165 [Marasmius crinis-equi]|uniref:Uncharacterized protein n=1 Tax=Marasmius crinis-equi TaxID=585013 RepID=A0ABR3ESH9_9AGAR
MPGPRASNAGAEGVGKVLPFRVGPWVSYEPPSSSSHTSSFPVMDQQDVDMEAPQISTLREEETPPPPRASNPRFKLKLVVKDKTKTITSSSAGAGSGKPRTEAQEGEEEEDDQEDQLIDDDDSPIPAASLASGSGSKRKAGSASTTTGSAKRKKNGKKADGGGGEGKLKEKVTQGQQAGAPDLAPTMSWFQANPATEQLEDSGAGAEGRIKLAPDDADTPLSVSSASASTKKKAKKTPAKKPKATANPRLKLIPPLLPPEDTVSEAGMTGTAASSPIGIHFDDFTPEPEAPSNIALDGGPEPPSTAQTAAATDQPINLEGIPVPVYPLPTKPFPVLPPPKISTGFAPNVPLDKSKAKVRHWRVANREIRGIAGGRWFTRAWVGEKESELAGVLAAGKANGVEGSLSVATGGNGAKALGGGGGGGGGTSASAPPGGTGKGSKKKGGAAANSSRSGSSVPEANGTGTTGGGGGGSARGPSKMRISQMAPPPPSSEAGDVDMAASAA